MKVITGLLVFLLEIGSVVAQDTSIERQLDVSYGKQPAQRLDIYATKAAKNLPVMIYVHGGGWHRGDKAAVGLKPEYFTNRGFVFVSVNYRFVPDVDILTQLQDSADAIAWVHSHISEYGGDPKRIHLIGHSAGAHHVAIIATNERFLQAAGKELDILTSVVELDTLALNVPSMMDANRTPTYQRAFGQDREVWKQISPRHHVDKGKGIPAFLLVVAGRNRPKIAQAKALQKALRDAGVRCEFVDAAQHNHGSLNRDLGKVDEPVTKAMEQFHDSIPGGPSRD